MVVLQILEYFLLILVVVAYYAIHKHLKYFKERGVVHDKPDLLTGNMRGVGKTEPLKQPFNDFYRKYKGTAPFGGFYMSLKKSVVILDLDLLQKVLITDFSYFPLRGNYYNEADDPLSAHIFNLDGDKWKTIRSKLTPTFTSGKMKFTFPTMIEVGERFVQFLKELQTQDSAGPVVVEVKELLARFSTDVIGSCAFGIECNSLKDPNAKFRQMGQRIFARPRHGRLLFAFARAYPDLARKFGISFLPSDIGEFFMNVVRETVEYREREKIVRNDFMNLLIELKNRKDTEGLTLEQIAAQAYVFFLAGFETTSSTMSFTVYELALNQDIQRKAREEIKDVYKKHDNQLTYEAINELKYLKLIFDETLRKYSIASITLRQTLHDYHVPNTNHVIEKGTVVIVPIDAIHHDPEIYPNPSEFIPERFTPEEIAKRHSVSYLAFGNGPRNCIGMRFGRMQAMMALALLLKNFNFSPTEKTPIPMVFDERSMVLQAKGGLYLKLETVVE